MSKATLLAVANFNLFQNSNPEIEFSIAKDNRVQAAFSGYDKTKGYDIRGIKAKSNAGVVYLRLSISTTDNGQREYHNGALFVNDKKTTDKQPDFQGSVNLDNKSDGPKLRLSAWKKKGEKAGDYLSIAIQEFMSKDQSAAQAPKPAAPAANSFDDFGASAPASSAPAKQAAPVRQVAPAQRSAAAPVPAGFDDMDDDIPFVTMSMFYDMTTSKARKMARYDY